jgi:hypothetical protein
MGSGVGTLKDLLIGRTIILVAMLLAVALIAFLTVARERR